MASLTFLDDIGTEMLYRSKCPFCSRPTSTVIDSYGWMLYEMGEKVQDAFPTLSKGQREVIVTGMCDECQDKIFKKS